MINLLITGGCGFIGTKLTEQLLDNKEIEKIVLYDLLEPPMQLLEHDLSKKIKFVKGDLTDKKLLLESTQEIDQIIHLAAIADVKKCKEEPEFTRTINVIGTKNILEVCQQNKIEKMIFASTMSAIYGNSLQFDENNEPTPISEYGKHKAEAEKFIQDFCSKNNLKGIILRKSNLFGLGFLPKQNVVNLFVNNAILGKPLKVDGVGQVRNFLHIGDACNAYTKAVFSEIKSNFEVFNISGKDTLSISNLAFLVKDEVEKKTQRKIEVIQSNQRGEIPQNPIISIGKAKSILEYEPEISLKMGINEIIEQQLQNNLG